MLDSTAAVAAERQGKNARRTGDDEIALSVITVLEPHNNTWESAPCNVVSVRVK